MRIAELFCGAKSAITHILHVVLVKAGHGLNSKSELKINPAFALAQRSKRPTAAGTLLSQVSSSVSCMAQPATMHEVKNHTLTENRLFISYLYLQICGGAAETLNKE